MSIGKTNAEVEKTNVKIKRTNARLDETNTRLKKTYSRVDEINYSGGGNQCKSEKDQCKAG